MAEGRVQRRLAAILAADVVGYSRLMESDEELTRARLRSLKYELIYPGDFANGQDLFTALENYFHFYNHHRPHQALGYRTPADLFPHRSKSKTSSS